ncbi:MAG: peptidase S24 [Rikenellaceae bacterium]|nr:peptidase S24 [Rikenellaceae bacterium]
MEHLEILKTDDRAAKAFIPRLCGLSAGFPSPATDYTGDVIDLNEQLITSHGNTYYARVLDDYLLEGELERGDAVLFDVSMRPVRGDMAVCVIDGETLLKRIDRRQGRYCLVEAGSGQVERLGRDSDSYVMGIVTSVIKTRRRKGRRTVMADESMFRKLVHSHKRAVRWGYRPEDAADTAVLVDLNRELVRNRIYTAYGEIYGDSLREDAIDSGDAVIIDRILDPVDGDLVMSYNQSEFLVKYIEKRADGLWLVPGNREYEPVRISEEEETDKLVWGIITYSIKQLRRKGGGDGKSGKIARI